MTKFEILNVANLLTKDQLYNELNKVNATRERRLEFANHILEDESLMLPLIQILFRVNDKISAKAAWVFEFVCDKKLELLLPYLDEFTNNISKVHLDSSVRPIAKVCQFVIEAYYKKDQNCIKENLSTKHKEGIVEACFNWLIQDEKVAPKVYSMNCLYLLGQEFDWIHPELRLIIERDFYNQSAGFKSKAKHIIKAMEKS